jgi:hypothetical protein
MIFNTLLFSRHSSKEKLAGVSTVTGYFLRQFIADPVLLLPPPGQPRRMQEKVTFLKCPLDCHNNRVEIVSKLGIDWIRDTNNECFEFDRLCMRGDLPIFAIDGFGREPNLCLDPTIGPRM